MHRSGLARLFAAPENRLVVTRCHSLGDPKTFVGTGQALDYARSMNGWNVARPTTIFDFDGIIWSQDGALCSVLSRLAMAGLLRGR